MKAKIKWTPFFNRNLHQRITTLSGRVSTQDETIVSLQEDMKLLRTFALNQFDEMEDHLTHTIAAINDDLTNQRNLIRSLLEDAKQDRAMLAEFMSKITNALEPVEIALPAPVKIKPVRKKAVKKAVSKSAKTTPKKAPVKKTATKTKSEK